ncbi:ATP-binding cassette domain-containing protein, partial [Thermodesulfatator autotrophicus]
MSLKVKFSKKLSAFNIEASFSIPEGKTLVLFGPSGSGKTTLLRILAGLEIPDKGKISFKNNLWVDTDRNLFIPARKRSLAFVFQEGVLFPHLSLRKNIALTAVEKEEGEKLLRIFGLWSLRDRKPFEVSGGERQRAALVQALARKPDLLLLDEPFSALDEKNKNLVISFLKDWQRKNKTTFVLVTHQKSDGKILGHFWLEVKNGKTNLKTNLIIDGSTFYITERHCQAT